MSRGQGNKSPEQKKSKKFEKPLDKPPKLCYNTSTVKENKRLRAELVKTEKGSDTMTNKMTYVKALEMAIASLPADFNEEAMEKLVACKASYEKRNASKSKGERKPTKKQIENEGIKSRIAELLEGHEPMQAKEVAAELGLSSSQQASALLRQMVEAGIVEKVVEKRISRFGLVKGE